VECSGARERRASHPSEHQGGHPEHFTVGENSVLLLYEPMNMKS